MDKDTPAQRAYEEGFPQQGLREGRRRFAEARLPKLGPTDSALGVRRGSLLQEGPRGRVRAGSTSHQKSKASSATQNSPGGWRGRWARRCPGFSAHPNQHGTTAVNGTWGLSLQMPGRR